jgi:hypothetical protein
MSISASIAEVFSPQEAQKLVVEKGYTCVYKGLKGSLWRLLP